MEENIAASQPIVDDADFDLSNLYPALIQCFGTIACGYVAGKLKIITNVDAKGLNTYVGTYALPAIIFTSLINLQWNTVNWMFLLSILISKFIVFIAVGIVSLLLSRPMDFGRAAILAIFCTQSNDFAIGAPIINALYDKQHKDYESYLFLMAPLSLAILNPIGYIFLEWSNIRKNTKKNDNQTAEPANNTRSGNAVMIFHAFKSIILNPVLFMTLLGTLGGFLLTDGLPKPVASILKIFADSFSATSLFILGLRMVDCTAYFKGPEVLTTIVLSLMKLLVLPLVIRQTVTLINPGTNLNDTTDLSTYGFLYGTFPSAPGAFVIANQYDVEVGLVASGMFVCTLVSAPIMYISAKMIALSNLNPSEYFKELESFSFDICVIGILTGIWTIISFVLSNRLKKMPYKIISCLLISQLFICIGVILWSYMPGIPDWSMYIQFSCFIFGCISSRIWCAINAVALLFIQYRSLCFVLKLMPLFIFVGWGIPSIIVAILFALDNHELIPKVKKNPSFQYGNVPAALLLFLTVISFIVTLGCLVLNQRYRKRLEDYLLLPENSEERGLAEAGGSVPDTPTPSETDIEDLFKIKGHASRQNQYCDSQFECSDKSRQHCQKLMKVYQNQTISHLKEFTENMQSMRHTVFLILLLCSMFVSISLAVWTLVMEGMSGIYIELSFLEAFLNFGQIILVSVCFLSDCDAFWKTLEAYYHKIRGVTRNYDQNQSNEIIQEQHRKMCQQFQIHHLNNCRKIIGSDRFVNGQLYKDAFYGTTFVNWLIRVGLVNDRREGVSYANLLIDYQILRNVNNIQYFHDKEVIYYFIV